MLKRKTVILLFVTYLYYEVKSYVSLFNKAVFFGMEPSKNKNLFSRNLKTIVVISGS